MPATPIVDDATASAPRSIEWSWTSIFARSGGAGRHLDDRGRTDVDRGPIYRWNRSRLSFQGRLDRQTRTKCACLGGDSNVPLGFISLTENLMMVGMAIWMMLK